MSDHTKSVIVVTDVFPPMAAVSVYRTVALCKHMAEQGLNVTVITARHWDNVAMDPELLRGIPDSVRVVRTASPHLVSLAARLLKGRRRSGKSNGKTPARSSGTGETAPRRSTLRTIIDWLSWWLHVPDTHIGWLMPAFAAGLREARRTRPSVIYATAPRWTNHLVGALLSKWTRTPLVADFQDPWCGSYWRRIPYAVHRRLDERLERWVIRRAARITCAWDGIRKHLAERYPERAHNMETILNGFDPEEFEHVEPVRSDTNRCVLLHAGAFYGPRSPEPLMAALKQLRAHSPNTADRLAVVLLGPPEYAGRPLSDIARQYGVHECVHVMPPVPRHEALALIKGANVSLLFGQSGYEALASVPAKTFDYVALGTPVLSIGGGEEVCDILRRAGCKLWPTPADDSDAIATALRCIAAEHRNRTLENTCDPDRPQFAWNVSVARLESTIRMSAELRTG